MKFNKQKKKILLLLKQKRGGENKSYYCRQHQHVITRLGCRDEWWSGSCQHIKEAKISRALCQEYNFPILTEIEPLRINQVPENRTEPEVKPTIKPAKESKMPINDKASQILSPAKNAKDVVKLAKNSNLIDPKKLKGIANQIKEGTATYGRAKMTVLNMLRGAMKSKGPAKKAKPASRAEMVGSVPKKIAAANRVTRGKRIKRS